MNLKKAIEVAKNKIDWEKKGAWFPYDKLNSELLTQALECLVDVAIESLDDGDGLGNK